MAESARAKIEALQKKMRPWLAEIAASPWVKGRSRTLRTVTGPSAGDPVVDAMLAAMHPGHLWIDSLGLGVEPAVGARWAGLTMIVEEPASVPRPAPEAGRFLLSLTYRPRPFGEVAITPVTFFWMRYDGALHRFEQRLVQSIGEHPIEEVPQELFLSYLQGAFAFYEAKAFANTAP